MADQQEGQEQVRCSSSESDNFEKIDSDEVDSQTNFTVGDSPDADDDDSGPSHEGGDSFPNAPPPNIRRVLTQAQQLALAEKRSTLRFVFVYLFVHQLALSQRGGLGLKPLLKETRTPAVGT
ncbi:unnamed protein product [Plutella xylostella]|uniref:(diamondback moth) hypothetical protein n=1 Tax=Plutella xylostella TaxID=51655 RepID=A0A8S4GBA9_PLUXY|nr:unnamed protein product [Plutella xylostella]